ncbi:xanthine dehydrogenase family protein molybdopterin-binding subunit [Streptomyces sp. NPDC003077]|uniref:xanthine dehydrogenase family protein molybdopterin-binding subunit n=1 Tax=Streptomyces sp. NPDC003077 TaxID=3154443 RepID=UPI0033BF8E4A
MTSPSTALGTPVARLEAVEKVTGTARYATDHTPEGAVHAWPVPADVARGRVTGLDTETALADPDVLAVLSHENAPRLGEADDATLQVLQSPEVAHRGQVVALAVARTLEAARAAALAVRVTYAPEPHDVVLTPDHGKLYVPEAANGGAPAVREHGDFDTAYAAAPVTVDALYTLTPLHNHPMEPHACVAWWEEDRLTVYDSNQGATTVRNTLTALFGLRPEQVRVVATHVGGGFGSKGTPRPQVVLAAMAARHTGRPVKLALPRQVLPSLTGHRAPTFQRVRLGADRDGRIQALAHEVATQTSTIKEFTEQAAAPSRVMYASPHSRTTHRVARLDVPTPSWMRAPGECPGMYALESAMDELACACGLDPIELRVRNEPDTEPDTGKPFSSRQVVRCLREGARRFGWEGRDPTPGRDRRGRLLIGTGVAAATYPVLVAPSQAEARATGDGRFLVRVAATDIGTGARTVLTQIAADALRAPMDRVRLELGDSLLPDAPVAGGSSGTSSWGWAVHKACVQLREALRDHQGPLPDEGLSAAVDTAGDIGLGQDHARHAFGAHFAEVQVDTASGEPRLRRLLGVFAVGRVLNPRTARSQLMGGMIMGVGMALTETSSVDVEYGDYPERDLASYHVPVNPDVPSVDVHWIEEEDPLLNPMGSKGIGEIGIVGTAAAIANAVHHATGRRLRALPVQPHSLLPLLG